MIIKGAVNLRGIWKSLEVGVENLIRFNHVAKRTFGVLSLISIAVGFLGCMYCPSPPPPLPSLLYIYYTGTGTPSATMQQHLAPLNLDFQSSTTLPDDLSDYDVIIVYSPNLGASEGARLGAFVDAGGGVALIEATPFYMGLANIASWFGASGYTNAGICTPALVVIDDPFSTGFSVGDEVAKSSCSYGGSAAIINLVPTATLVAAWTPPGDQAFSFVHEYGDGRVYYHAQFGGEYPSENSWDLFLGGIRWLLGQVEL